MVVVVVVVLVVLVVVVVGHVGRLGVGLGSARPRATRPSAAIWAIIV